MSELSSILTFEPNLKDQYMTTTIDNDRSYLKAKEFFERVQRPCCPNHFPGYQTRNPLIQQIVGEHRAPDPVLPFWWSEGIVNSPQAKEMPWLRQLLAQVTWSEMMEGRIEDRKFKQNRENWAQEQRKMVSSPKIGNMLNILFIREPKEVLHFRNRDKEAKRMPFWWYRLALHSISYASFSVGRFLAQTELSEFTEGRFEPERLHLFCEANKRRPPKNESIETFLRGVFSEFPQVITRFNQRGSKASFIMRIAADPYSIVTMSSRSPHWTSCQNPIQNDTHEMSHRLWANLLDPNMALMEMVDPAIDEDNNLVARAIVRIVRDRKRELLYLDCLYGERGYISSFVSLCRALASEIGLPPISGRMIPFYTDINTAVEGYPINFDGYEPPYLDFGQWRKEGHLTLFHGNGHYIVDNK